MTRVNTDIFKEVSVFKVDSNDLEDFLEQEYGHNPELMANWEASNGTTKEMNIDGTKDDDDDDDIENFKEYGESDYGTPEILMNDLCRQGRIKPGTYFIKFYW